MGANEPGFGTNGAGAGNGRGEELWKEFNRTPFFMKEYEDSVEMEALQALAYEGTPEEVALNFKEHGNDAAHEGRWLDARNYYTKAIDTQPSSILYSNRALAYLRLGNFGSALRDCKQALALDGANEKARYRGLQAFAHLRKYVEGQVAAGDAPDTPEFNELRKEMEAGIQREEAVSCAQVRKERQANTLRAALAQRKIHITKTGSPPEMHGVEMSLEDGEVATSTLFLPVVIVYPLAAQTDLVTAWPEGSTPREQLEVVLPDLPWDAKKEYVHVKTFMETHTQGLISVGMDAPLLAALQHSSIHVQDGVVRLLVAPDSQTQVFVETWKRMHQE